MTRFSVTAALVLLVSGCAASAPSEDGARPTRGLFSWSPLPEAGDVARLRERARAFADAPACLAALVAEAPDLAHGLYLAEDEPAARLLLARALSARDPAYGASAAAEGGAPAEHAAARRQLLAVWSALEARTPGAAQALDATRAAAERLEALGDPLLAAQARLLCVAIALQRGEASELAALEGALAAPASPAGPLAAQVAVLRLGAAHVRARADDPAGDDAAALAAAAREAALGAGAWSLLLRLEELRAFGVGPLAGEARQAWWRALARLSLARGHALEGLRLASSALEWSREHDASAALADRVLVARACLAAGRVEGALLEAEGAAADASGGASVRAEGARGEALLRLGRVEQAEEAFALAEAQALEGGDADARLQHALNRATCILRRGDGAGALRALEGLSGATGDLGARRRVLATLAGLLSGELDADRAAAQVEATLDRARRSGLCEVVESYRDLPARLRGETERQG